MDVGVSVTSLPFAAVVVTAVLVLTPLVSALGRRLALGLINGGFLVLLNPRAGMLALAVVVSLWLVLHLIARARPQVARWGGVFVLATLLCLFVLNKRPTIVSWLGTSALGSALALIGFSYVFLRAAEQLRWVIEQRRAPALLDHVNFLVPFHMLAAGPIQAYADFLKQPSVPVALDVDTVLWSVERIAWGLFKKLVLAHFVERFFLTGFTGSWAYSLLEMQFCFLWLYLDFSSYSDIAVGVGRLIGVHTPENFRAPYLARNLVDFWERWHISLSFWIRRNLFTPLQLAFVRQWGEGSGLTAASIAFTLSFLLCGVWHDPSWPYFWWGALHAVGLVVTNLYRIALKRRLGASGVKAYLNKRSVRWAATFFTYEYVAASLFVIVRN
jgi:D-alanyl-lipoteichoic acid acyltransferase DltB (MBOAT superfamily)